MMNFEMAYHIYKVFLKDRDDAKGMKVYYEKKLADAQKRLAEAEDEAEKKRIGKEVCEAEDDIADEIERIQKAAAVINYLERKTLADTVAE